MKFTLTKILTLSALLIAAINAAAQMPLVLINANAPTSEDWAKAAPILRDAIECKAPFVHSKVVRSSLRLTNNQFNGEHRFPKPLLVFGTLVAEGVSIFEGSADEGSSYTVTLVGVKIADAAKVAKLKKDGGRYVRTVKNGIIEASEPQPGVVQIGCIRGGDL